MKDIAKNLHGVIKLGILGTVVYSVCFIIFNAIFYTNGRLLYQASHRPADVTITVHRRTVMHWTAFIAFLVCVIMEVLNFISASNVLKKRLVAVFIFVTGISGFSYLCLVFGLAPEMEDFNGRNLEGTRYLHWCVTTPLLIGSIAAIAKMPHTSTATTIFFDVTMMLTGFLSSYSRDIVWIWIWGAISFLCWPIVMHFLWKAFCIAIATAIHPNDETSLRRLRTYSMFLWTGFPVIWLLSSLQLISEDAAELGLVFCDAAAKFVFAFMFSTHDFMSYGRADVLNNLFDEDVFTDLSLTNKRLSQAKTMLERGTTAVSEKMEGEKEFMKSMNHELRTPLNSIINFNTLLLESGNLAVSEIENILTALSSAETLRSMIDNLLNFNKIQSTGVILEKKHCDLIQILENAVHSLDHIAEKNKVVAILLELDEGLPAMVRSDPDRLSEIFFNLIQNAVKFNKPNGTVSVIVNFSESKHKVELNVVIKDTGIGISEQNLQTIFMPFAKLKQVSEIGGTGTGLAIVKELVNVFGGRIDVSSTLGSGTSVRLNLTLKKSQQLDTRCNNYEGHMFVEALGTDYPYRHFILKTLQSWKCTVDSVTPAEAVATAEKKGPTYIYLVSSLTLAKLLNDKFEGIFVWACGNLTAKVEFSNNIPKATSISFCPEPITATRIRNILPRQSLLSATSARTSSEVTPVVLSDLYVLVVDDNPINRKVAGAILKRWNVKFDEAVDGAVCCDLVSRNRYDVILMDIQMPVMDGLEATRQIRAMKSLVRQPFIIAASANCLDSDRAECSEAGMDDFVPKPIKLHMLEQSMNRVPQTCRDTPKQERMWNALFPQTTA